MALSDFAKATSIGLGNAIVSMGGFAPISSTEYPQWTGTSNSSYDGTMFFGAAAPPNGPRNIWGLGLLLAVGAMGVTWF